LGGAALRLVALVPPRREQHFATPSLRSGQTLKANAAFMSGQRQFLAKLMKKPAILPFLLFPED